MSTQFPANEHNIDKAVKAIKIMTNWPIDVITRINDKLEEWRPEPKYDDLRLVRRTHLEALNIDANKTYQFLDMQNQRHKEEIKAMEEFIDFCKNDDVGKTLLDEFQIFQQKKAADRSASAPPDYSKKSLTKHYRIKY
tara:strand:+ start:676 stop:1089 length:414 start_codon:yes stop_codon:yes gene_type:complete